MLNKNTLKEFSRTLFSSTIYAKETGKKWNLIFLIFVVSIRRIAYHILVNPGKMKKIQKKLEQKWLRICPKGFSMHLDA